MTGQISAIVREIVDRVYPVHIILDFAAEVDPNVSIGCGTVWTRIADGRVLIASSDAHAVGTTCGAETVTLTEQQLPKITGGIGSGVGASGNSTSTGRGAFRSADGAFSTSGECMYDFAPEETPAYGGSRYQRAQLDIGGGQAHSNMQPSLAVCRWQRTA